MTRRLASWIGGVSAVAVLGVLGLALRLPGRAPSSGVGARREVTRAVPGPELAASAPAPGGELAAALGPGAGLQGVEEGNASAELTVRPGRLAERPAERPRGLGGLVLAAGEPLAGASVALHEAVERGTEHDGFAVRFQPRPRASGVTDERGSFALPVAEPGEYFLLVDAAGWAPAERGPLRLDPGSGRKERVELGCGGSLEIHVRSSAGSEVAGQVVALSRGDGRARRERTGPDGVLLLEGLTPGPWQVLLAADELRCGVDATVTGVPAPGEIPWDCRVSEGRRTRLELWMEGTPGSCRLEGRLVIDGAPAPDWFARLDGPGRTGELVPFESPGRFVLGADRPGEYGLFLTSGASAAPDVLVILERLDLAAGANEWSLELETAAVEGRLDPDLEVELAFHELRRGRTIVLAPLVCDSEGAFRCPRVPAGRGRLVSYDPGRPLDEQEPELLLEVGLERGETLVVRIP